MAELPNPYVEPLMTVPDFARAMGIPRSTVYFQITNGMWPTVKTADRAYRIVTARVYEVLGLPLPSAPEAVSA